MQRLTFPTDSTYTEDQRRVADVALKSARGRISGPLPAWLMSPVAAEHLHRLGAYLGYGSTLPRDVVELAIVTTAHDRGCDYAWEVHLPRAHQYGVDPSITAAILDNRRPDFASEKLALAFDVTKALCQTSTLTDAQYQQATKLLGDQGLVELVALVGLYHIVSMSLNVFGSVGVPHKNSE